MKTNCNLCDGSLAELGALGNLRHYRCVNCGADQSEEITVRRKHKKNYAPRRSASEARLSDLRWTYNQCLSWVRFFGINSNRKADVAGWKKKAAVAAASYLTESGGRSIVEDAR